MRREFLGLSSELPPPLSLEKNIFLKGFSLSLWERETRIELPMRVLFPFLFLLVSLTQCAFPYRYSIGDLDNTSSRKKHFQILVSERGYNFGEAIGVAQVGLYAANRDQNVEGIRNLEYIKVLIQLSTMGPTTGQKLYNSDYADQLGEIILKFCPSGKVVNLRNIREAARYPVVSGEIVRIEGDCLE
jgi:hypothetical protein